MTLCVVSCGEEKVKQELHSVMTTTPQSVGGGMVKNFSGVVKENGESAIGFKTAGQIEHLYVKEGDHVKKGQVIARLDSKDYKLGVEAIEVQYEQMSAEVKRMKQLYDAKSLSANDYEKAVSGLKQLGVQLQVNKNKVEYTTLHSPVSGVVKSVGREIGEMVDAGTTVFTLLDLGAMEVELSVPYGVYMKRNEIDGAYCTAGGERCALRLKSIVPKADNTQLFTARFGVEGNVTAGQSVDVVLNINSDSEDTNLFSVPQHSVFEHEGKACVWVVGKDSTVSRRTVGVKGKGEDGSLLVESGLNGSETIVRAGVNALVDKEKVKIITKSSDTNIGGLL